MSDKKAKATQVQGKTKGKPDPIPASAHIPSSKTHPCPWLCDLVPTNVPRPGPAQTILHPGKDVFVLKVAKIGATGDRRCKMELELVTPKGPEKKIPYRVDTKGEQCDPDPPLCSCYKPKKRRKQT